MFDYEAFRTALRSLVATLYSTVTSSEWVNLPREEQEKVNTAMHAIDKVFNKKLRPVYDQALYDAVDNGKCRSGLEPVRKRKQTDDSDKPAEPTMDEWLEDITPVIESEQITLDLV